MNNIYTISEIWEQWKNQASQVEIDVRHELTTLAISLHEEWYEKHRDEVDVFSDLLLGMKYADKV